MALFRFLHSLGEIDQQEAHELRALASQESRHPIEVLEDRVNAERVADLLHEQLGLPLIDLRSTTIDAEVLQSVPRELAARYDVFPVRRHDKRLVLATANPLDGDALKAVQFATQAQVEPAVAPLAQVRDAIRRNYFLKEELESLLDAGTPRDRLDMVEAASLDAVDVEEDDENKSTVVRLVEMLLLDGLRLEASDVHIEPSQDEVLVRYRVNGVLEAGMSLPQQLRSQIVSRVKIMASLDITERRRPQDGAIRLKYQGRQVDVRVSVLPNKSGEKVVLRLLDPEAKGHALDSLGLLPEQVELLRRESRRPEGLVLISGPTGSGKSTTAHALLGELATSSLNIVTIENPIERRIAGITQVEVNEKQGVTFAGTLRSILRQDPDVIFVGEIRDEETAKIALQASQTGHLVLTTVHTIDASSSLTRLFDLGLDPMLVASSLRVAIAQRLLRVGCPGCGSETREPSDTEKAQIERFDAELTSVTTFPGCPRCRTTGFIDRQGAYEIVPILPSVRAALESRSSESEIRATIRREGIESMPAAAIRMVNAGQTTLDEVIRVIPPDSVASPLVEEEAEAEGDTAPEADHPRVLVVEDDRTMARLIQASLEQSDLTLDVRTVSDAPSALMALEAEEFHLALLDIGLPGSSGLELCARIRATEAWKNLPIFMSTTRDDDDAKVEAFRAGADDYIVKPLRPRELAARVARVLDRRLGHAPQPSTEPLSDEPLISAPAPVPEPPPAQEREPSHRSAEAAERAPAPPPEPVRPPRRSGWRRFLGLEG